MTIQAAQLMVEVKADTSQAEMKLASLSEQLIAVGKLGPERFGTAAISNVDAVAGRTAKDVDVAAKAARSSLKDLEAGVSVFSASPAAKNLATDINKAQMGLSAMATGSGMSGLALGGTVALAAGVADIGAKSLKASADFQTMITNIHTNTTMSQADVDTLKKAIISLSVETGAPLDHLAKGFMHIVDLSGDASTAPAVLEAAAKAAVATGGDVESYANIAAQAMHEYGLDTSSAATQQERFAEIQKNATNVMGLFHLAAADSNATVEQFADHTSKAVGVAANFKVPLEQVMAVTVSLSKHAFPDLAQAQTQVVDMMNKIANPTKASREELEKISKVTGVDLVNDFTAAGLAQRGLAGVIEDVKTAFEKEGLSEADATGEAEKLINAQRGGLGLAVEVGTGYKDLTDEVSRYADKQKVATITEDSFQEKLGTVQNKQDRATASMHAAGIEIGDHLMPIWTGLLDKVADPHSWDTFDKNVKAATDGGDSFAKEWKDNVDATGKQFSDLGTGIQNTLLDAQGAWDTAAQEFADRWKKAVGDVGGAFSALGSLVHGAFSGGGGSGFSSNPDGKPFFQASTGQPTDSASNGGVANIPSGAVGHNASGTDFWGGGSTWVGEEGPELLNLPRGSSITPASKLAGSGDQQPINIVIQADGPTSAMLQSLSWKVTTQQNRQVGLLAR